MRVRGPTRTPALWSRPSTWPPRTRRMRSDALAVSSTRAPTTPPVDSTFASPCLTRPLGLGADLVLHSSTKFIGGHSDVVGGAVLTSNDDVAAKLRFHQNAVGAVPSPFDCWLLMRGIKTLELRVIRQSDSAMAIARWLDLHNHVRHVYYPGLSEHPGHALARKQMSGRFGGVVSFDVHSRGAAQVALRRLNVFTLAESLGAVESLAELPAA